MKIVEITQPEYFIGQADVLYHGTTINRAKLILQQGIQPNLGAWMRSVYPRAKGQPVVIAADQNSKLHILKAIRFHLALDLYGSPDSVWEVTIPQFLANGAVVEIRTDQAKFRQATAMHKPQRGIERTDYYTFEPVQADRIIAGSELLSFFDEPLLLGYLQYDHYDEPDVG